MAVAADVEFVRADVGCGRAFVPFFLWWQGLVTVHAQDQFAAFDIAFKAVHFTQKFGHKRIVRCIVQGRAAAHLFDFAMVHHHDLVGNFQGFFLVVGHEQAGDIEFVVYVAQPLAQLFAHLGIERAKRLIQKQQFWFHSQSTGQGHTLALAA